MTVLEIVTDDFGDSRAMTDVSKKNKLALIIILRESVGESIAW